MESISCVGSGGDPAKCKGSAQDDQGHGTHVSGIAAASKDNGKGIAGVAPDAQLVVAKVMNAQGTGPGSDVTAGVKWVVDHGAKVVNLSLGDPAQPITALISENELKEGRRVRLEQGRHRRPRLGQLRHRPRDRRCQLR